MIGFYGIVAVEHTLDSRRRTQAFSRMSNELDERFFYNKSASGSTFSIGMTFRTLGENRDLALKAIEEDFIIAFTGYGKFVGEKALCWADEMIDRIAHVFCENRKATFSQIEGSFSLLLLHHNQLFIVSDRFGSKPLYYYHMDDILVFAPSVGRILASRRTCTEPNIEAATQLLVSGFFLDNATLAKNIWRFPYATVMTKNLSPTTPLQTEQYWTLPKTDGHIDIVTSDLIDKFYEIMRMAVLELVSLQPKAVLLLSGGLDSRAIGCFLAPYQNLSVLTYDMRDEAAIAKRVSRLFGAEFTYFSNALFSSPVFRHQLKQLVDDQQFHCVVNQYFYAPLFKQYFRAHSEHHAVYDGVYLDGLFNVAYDCANKFDVDDFINTYGGSSFNVLQDHSQLTNPDAMRYMKHKYEQLTTGLLQGDAVGKSQNIYFMGRLRRYVNESPSARENCCYVLKPAYNYQLADFAFGLTRRLRAGKLYTAMLCKAFPNAMSIPFKDQYGIKKLSTKKRLLSHYRNMRRVLSSASNGKIPYFPYQTNYFFVKQKGIYDYRDLFLQDSPITALIDKAQMLRLFYMTQRKHHLLGLFQRVLFIQQFFLKYLS